MQRILNARFGRLCLVVFCLSCLGCGSADSKQGDRLVPGDRPLSENLNEMVELGKELKFCVSEEAGLKTLKSTFDRMVSVLDAIPSSIQAAGLSSDDQAKLTTAVEKIQAACKNAQLDSEASYAGLCKDMADPLEVVETHSQQ